MQGMRADQRLRIAFDEVAVVGVSVSTEVHQDAGLYFRFATLEEVGCLLPTLPPRRSERAASPDGCWNCGSAFCNLTDEQYRKLCSPKGLPSFLLLLPRPMTKTASKTRKKPSPDLLKDSPQLRIP